MATLNGKLTKAQNAVLQAAFDDRDCMISYSHAHRAGGNGKTLSALVSRGLLIERRYSNGKVWELTREGRSALAEEQRQ